MKFLSLASIWSITALVVSTVAFADGGYYGAVDYFGNGGIGIRTTAHSFGHWQVDGRTRISGNVRPGDWVFAQVETSGRVSALRFEERPSPHSGVIIRIQGPALFVRSGNGTEEWNVVETTKLSGIAPGTLRRGDGIGVQLYGNHNMEELRLIRRDRDR